TNEGRISHLASFPQLNPNPVLEVDRAGEIVYCNPAAHRFLAEYGMDAEECRMFLPPDMERILTELETQKESAVYREIIIADRIFGQTVQLVPQFEKIRLYAYDITERKRAEVALKLAYEEMEKRVEERTVELRDKDQMLLLQSRQAAMGEMIGNIAHQWRQPLNTLGLMIQRQLLIYDLGEFTREMLEKDVSSSMEVIQHMSRTIDDFRNYFRPDKEKIIFNVHDVIVNTLSLLEGTLQNTQINITIVAKDDPVIYGYQNEYSQVLLNILMNAKDALLERNVVDPRVTITICSENGCAVVTVSDSAGGIPEDITDKIFDPYFTTKGPQQGTGVGLFMSKTIIEKNMGGRLSVRNSTDGAEFRIEVCNES
ncbi:MAG: PAS domain-containing sensor histidine kinase, partial [Desulfuromonadaceae bacterium]